RKSPAWSVCQACSWLPRQVRHKPIGVVTVGAASSSYVAVAGAATEPATSLGHENSPRRMQRLGLFVSAGRPFLPSELLGLLTPRLEAAASVLDHHALTGRQLENVMAALLHEVLLRIELRLVSAPAVIVEDDHPARADAVEQVIERRDLGDR